MGFQLWLLKHKHRLEAYAIHKYDTDLDDSHDALWRSIAFYKVRQRHEYWEFDGTA